MTLAAGEKLGPYEILAALGAGGMGQVYRARDTRLGREVAIKLVAERLTRDRSAVDRFVREAHAASRLNHPNIVTIHEIGEADVGRFIVMELVQGRTLREMVTARIAWESLVDLGRQIAKALAAAHAEGIVHRDVKPENVMVRDDGYVKVLDFGLARLLPTDAVASEVDTASGTEAGTVLGTIRYMAPEQACGERVEGAADVFALGLVLYELATGRHPFGADRPFGVIDAIVGESVLPPSRLNPEIPSPLDALLLQMLEKDPRRRPTATDVDALLAQVSSTSPTTRTRRFSGPSQRRSVGREGERAALRAAFESAAAGDGLFVCVAGEPGIGKTTLVEDFLVELEAEGHSRVARGRCSERLAGAEAYLPWLEALEDLVRSASGAEMARLMRLVAPSWYAQVAPTDAEIEKTPGEPRAASQERIKREVAALLQEAARVRPLVLFFDDLHWSDVSTVDLLTYVGTKLSSMRLLVVATFRPSELALSQHPFGSVKLDLQSRGVCRELSLGFLSQQEVSDYVALEFPDHHFPADFPDFIHAKTEGSPLFVAGLLRDLRDREILAQDGGRWSLVRGIPAIERELPESVQSMIQRKIEKLEEADRQLLIAASVQGYEFDSAVVARALRRDTAGVEDRLDALERVHAFIRRVDERELPDRTLSVRYRFVHVLYQNVLYGSLTPTRKTALSAAVGNALTAHYGDARSEIVSELALLFEAARDSERAIEYFLLAARRAAQMFAHQEAIVLSRRALALLQLLPETPERDRRELDLLVTLGPAVGLIQGFSATAVEEILLRARDLCRRMEDTARLFPVLYGLCVLYVVRAERRLAHDLSNQLDALAEETKNPLLRLQACHAIWTALVAEGELVKARARLKEGIALYNLEKHASQAHSYGGHDPGVCCLAFNALALWALGYPDQALARARDALAIARDLSHPVSIGQAQCYTAMLHQLRREAPAARDHAHGSITLTRDWVFPQFLSYGNVLHGWALGELDNADEGLIEIREGLYTARAIENRFLLPHWLALSADLSRKAGMTDDGLAAADEGLREALSRGQCFSQSELHRLKGELLLLRGERDEAEACFHEAIDVARRQSARSFELRAATSLARSWQSQHRNGEARLLIEEVYGWFTEGLDTADLVEARALLGELS
jgi:predicted ATPase/tRNA A-37 threonylcarbamoyl transferase component Bud32